MKDLVIATRNEKKLRELKRYLKSIKADVVSLNEIGPAPGIREDKNTFKGNAVKKALVISKFTCGLVLADDSGLEVKALGGAPGVKSARFAGPKKKDHDNNVKVLKMLSGMPAGRRQARFVCAIAIADKGRVVKLIEEYCSGRIADSIRGRHGFGYDSIFLIPKYKKTFGQLGFKTKDRMSHRSKALKKAREFLRYYL
ncbi:MAG: RdgB/HAM1 family non-canonical purine NTP pyrophosphatase [Candidatus Omnitrophota bacterium]|nr:RdgB/HAM1 family non-canonical purine NTP pyrophosphatase [Candidatus Omnitrophota bacterium]